MTTTDVKSVLLTTFPVATIDSSSMAPGDTRMAVLASTLMVELFRCPLWTDHGQGVRSHGCSSGLSCLFTDKSPSILDGMGTACSLQSECTLSSSVFRQSTLTAFPKPFLRLRLEMELGLYLFSGMKVAKSLNAKYCAGVGL